MDIGLKTLSDITSYSKYAKYIPEVQRRETWDEIVDRYELMMLKKYPSLKDGILKHSALIRDKKVLPSMRALQFSGIAADVNNARIYNCAYLPVDSIHSFSETMFLLLGGSGVGFSVQKHHINQLPVITIPTKKRRYVVQDSIIGWADAVKVLMKAFLDNKALPEFDFRDVRPKGARLITAGGKAPGPEPLKICLAHIQAILERKKDGDKLTSLECHDIQCHIANAVLAGGIRRSAMISLFDLNDEEMLTCKYGNWWELNEQRGRANNSAVLVRGEVTEEEFFKLWKKIELSGSGEPGFYWTNNKDWGTNPCCFIGDMKLLTSNGYKSFSELSSEEEIELVNYRGEIVKGKVWSNGIKDVITLKLSNGKSITCTPDHRLMLNDGSEIEAKDSKGLRLASYVQLNNNREPLVVSINKTKEKEEVFDFSLEDEDHWGVVEGIIAHNCEIGLRPYQFCNLAELNVSNIESQEDLEQRVLVATFFGTLQAGFTDFHYLRPIWQRTTEKDALLGIGMTGIGSGEILKYDLKKAAKKAKKVNKELSEYIGINPAARITTIKPSGTTSCILGTSSGIHAWHDQYYLRTIRFSKNEEIAQYIINNHPELYEVDKLRSDTICVRIPIKAPKNSIMRSETAIDTLERVKKFSQEWVSNGHNNGDNTHNVSATISIDKNRLYAYAEGKYYSGNTKDDPNAYNEWEVVGNWMWDNREYYNGLSVLPYDNGTYVQAPFETITEEEYNNRVKVLNELDLTQIIEVDDNVNFGQIASCAGGSCEIN